MAILGNGVSDKLCQSLFLAIMAINVSFCRKIKMIPVREKNIEVQIIGTSPLKLPAAAFQALPEPYKNDSCLLFWIEDDLLLCRPLDDQVQILGGWVYYFCDENNEWFRLS